MGSGDIIGELAVAAFYEFLALFVNFLALSGSPQFANLELYVNFLASFVLYLAIFVDASLFLKPITTILKIYDLKIQFGFCIIF